MVLANPTYVFTIVHHFQCLRVTGSKQKCKTAHKQSISERQNWDKHTWCRSGAARILNICTSYLHATHMPHAYLQDYTHAPSKASTYLQANTIQLTKWARFSCAADAQGHACAFSLVNITYARLPACRTQATSEAGTASATDTVPT
jgi:hypothetical protein